MDGLLILPSSGLVCPECGFEAKRLPDGNVSDGIAFGLGGDKMSPYYHAQCVQRVLLQRDAEYVQASLRPYTRRDALTDSPSPAPKEEGHGSSGAS